MVLSTLERTDRSGHREAVATVVPTLRHEWNEVYQCGAYRRLKTSFSAVADFGTN